MKITRKIKIIGLATVFACSASIVGEVQAVDLVPEGIQRGNVTFLPTLTASESYNDNIYLQPDNSAQKKSSWIGEVSPGLAVEVELGKHMLTGSYLGKYGTFHSSSSDNYGDHEFKVGLDMDFSESLGLMLDAGQNLGHDDRGSDDTPIFTPEPNEYHSTSVGTQLRVGLIDSNRVEAGASYTDLDYKNNATVTDSLQRTDAKFDASLFWEVMPKTSVLIGGDYVKHDYETLQAYDSKDMFYFVGLDWKATGKTDGNVKLGYKEKTFSNNSSWDWDAFSWDASITWKPVEYSEFVVNTGRFPAESSSAATLTVEDEISVLWTHQWIEETFSTNVKGELGTTDYQGVGQTREDDRSGIILGADYKFNRWGMFSVDYSYNQRDSNVNTSDYEKNKLMFSIKTAL